MKDAVQALPDAIDEAVQSEAAPGERLDLYLFGRASLVWHYGAFESTKDVDVLRPKGDPEGLMARAVDLFRKGTDGAERLGVYLDAVLESIPPMPPGYRDRATLTEGSWTVERVWRLDPHDIIVSKFKRFHEGDRQDIKYLCDSEGIDPAVIGRRYDSAFWVHYKTPEGDLYDSRRDLVLRYLREGVGL